MKQTNLLQPIKPVVDPCLAGGGEMGVLMRALEWSQTPLGPVQAWPQSLRTAVSICLNSRFPILIWWGAELVMLYNDAYRPILGATKHPQSMGQPGRDTWPEIWSIIGPMLEVVITQGEATWSQDQLLILDRNGYLEECYFTFSYSPIREENGQIGGIFCAVTETSAKVISERRLRTLHALAARAVAAQSVEEACTLAMQTLADNRSDLPFALLYLLDDAAQELYLAGATGLTAGESASPYRVAINPNSATSGHKSWPFAQVLAHGQMQQVPALNKRFGVLPGGPWLDSPTTALILPISSPTQSQPTGLLVAGISPRRALDEEYRSFLNLVAGQVAAAVTDARTYEAERQRAEALAALDRAKNTFFSNVSHELRTPLTLILGPLDDILQHASALNPADRIALEMVYGNSLRLLKLVNTLLDFSRLQEGRVQAQYEPTDLAAYTAELAGGFRSAIERAELQLNVICPPLPEPVYVDREMWEKIVLNLLSNAFKFTLEGEITVTLLGKENQIVLAVSDTGTGIAAAEVPHLFSRFHRVRGAVARTQEGTGIGLALVQELTKLHGGTVTVTSTYGEGSTFCVTLPTGFAHLPTDQIRTTSVNLATPTSIAPFVTEAFSWQPDLRSERVGSGEWGVRNNIPHSELPAPNSPLVLLVDDNLDMRTYLTHLLRDRYRVQSVADGAAALAAVRASRPNLVLTDVMMPTLDGFGLLQAIRRDPTLHETPVILLSARAGEEARVEGLQAGADDYLVKPFAARELLARIEAHLSLQRLRKETLVALQQSEERFRIVSELTSDYAYAFQVLPNGKLQHQWIFGAFAQITGYTPEEYEKRNGWRALVHPADLPIAIDRVEKLMAGETDTSEFRIITKTGETRWLRDYARPQTDATGRVICIIGAARDITIRKQAEEALQRSANALRALTETLEQRVAERTAELERSNRELDQFAYVASHDLKTPLRGINNLANWIAEDAGSILPSPSVEHLSKLQGRIQRMDRLLDDLLEYSRVGRLEDKEGVVDTGKLIQEVVNLLAPPEGFSIRVDPALPTLVTSHAPLEMVFRNLIGNAIKHHPQPFKGEIHIGAYDQGDFVEFCVRDNGAGIPPQHHERIFGMFQVLRPRDEVEGSGMGLAIVRKTVEHQKGKIRIESMPDQGTTFYFTWPK